MVLRQLFDAPRRPQDAPRGPQEAPKRPSDRHVVVSDYPLYRPVAALAALSSALFPLTDVHHRLVTIGHGKPFYSTPDFHSIT